MGRAANLSFEQAIQLAIGNNLSTLLAQERRNEARGPNSNLLAALLPMSPARPISQPDREPCGARFPAWTDPWLQFQLRWSIQKFRRSSFVDANNLRPKRTPELPGRTRGSFGLRSCKKGLLGNKCQRNGTHLSGSATGRRIGRCCASQC